MDQILSHAQAARRDNAGDQADEDMPMMDNITHTLFNVAAAVGSVEEIPNELNLNQVASQQP